MSSSSSYITLTVVTENRTYTSNVGCDNLDYPAHGLFSKRLLSEDISSLRELFDILYNAYDGIYTECDIIQGLETSEISELKDFSAVNEIIIEDEVSGDVSYFELEMNPDVEEPNVAMKIVEKYNFKTKEYSRKRYIENWDNGEWYLLDEKEVSDGVNQYNTSINNDSPIPNGTTEIEQDAFCYDTKLTNITIPDSVVSIGMRAFTGCDNLSSVHIGSGVVSIGESAFNCCNITEITIPNSVTNIDAFAFECCENLKDITIGSGVTNIGDGAFLGCEHLVNINVDESNKNYCSIDGNLFSKDNKILIQYAIGKHNTSYTIPDGVIKIDASAFEGCSWLKNITLPDSVTNIDDSAFYECKKLKSINIPKNVTRIADSAFEFCTCFTINGYKGSYAEQYAKENNIPFKEI